MNPTSPVRTRGRQFRTSVGTAVVAAAVVVGLLNPSAQAATSSTTITPAGDSYQAVLSSGSTASFTAGSITVTCSTSQTSGQVPPAPGNMNPLGPVSSPITPPSFTNCSSSVFLVTPSVSTNNTNGDWTIALQYDPAGVTGTLTIPQGGQVITTTGLANCTVTVAPSGPVTIAGTWTPGTATTAPTLSFNNVSVPISATGSIFCPTSATTGTFSASYDVSDTTNPSAQIAVTS